MNRYAFGLFGVTFGLCSFGPALADDKKPVEIPGWGTVTDPDGDCSVREEKGKVTISIPDHDADRAIPLFRIAAVLGPIGGRGRRLAAGHGRRDASNVS